MRSNPKKEKKEKVTNPALKIRDFYSFGKQIITEINFAREHPDEFIEKLEELRETVEGATDNYLYINNVPFLYNDLCGSLDDAISFLKKQNPVEALTYNKNITQACDYLLDELIAHDGLEDEKIEEYTLEKRLNLFGKPFGEIYELIDYGMFDPEFIVINFILCDDDKKKYERNVIFNPKIKYIGIASSILPSDKICTIINCCEEFFSKKEKIPTNILKKYEETTPTYNTKTINNYCGKEGDKTNLERYTSNTKQKGNVHEQFTEEINSKTGDNGDVYTCKTTQYVQRQELNDDDDYNKFKNKKDAKESLRRKKTKHEPVFDDIDEEFNDDFFDKEFDIKGFDEENPSLRGQKKKKTTTTTTTTDENGVQKTVTTTVCEVVDDDGNIKTYYKSNDDNDLKKQKKNLDNKKFNNDNINEKSYKKKIVEIPIKFKNKKEENEEEEFPEENEKSDKKYKKQTKTVYETSEYPNEDNDIEKEIQHIEKEFKDVSVNPKKKAFKATDDMYEKEEDFDLPEGAVGMQVQQKTIRDSKGVPSLIVKKTITFEDGSVRTIIEKKKINEK